MTHTEKLEKIKDLRYQQRLLRVKLTAVRRYKVPQSTAVAIKRAMIVLDILEDYKKLTEQIQRLASSPAYRVTKRSIFAEGIDAVQDIARQAISSPSKRRK